MFSRSQRLSLLLPIVLSACAATSQPSPLSSPSSGRQNQVANHAFVGVRIPLVGDTELVLLDANQARRLIGTPDTFIKAMSALDRQLRLESKTPVDEPTLLAHLVAQVRPFGPAHVERMRAAVARVAAGIERAGLSHVFGREVPVVLTTGREEGSDKTALTYTREGVIYLNERALAEEPWFLLAHELFHVYGHHHPGEREELYRALGFVPIARLVFPPNLEARRITSPETPYIEHAIRVRYEERELLTAFVMLSDGAYEGGDMLSYATVECVVLDTESAQPSQLSADAGFVNYMQVSNLAEQVGRNTSYLAGPEEILADNLQMLINAPERALSPELLERVRRLMAGPDARPRAPVGSAR